MRVLNSLTFGLMFLLAAASSQASVIDAPHNATHQVKCSSCHKYTLWWEYSPGSKGSEGYDLVVNNVCMTCHDIDTPGPVVKTHSAGVLNSNTYHGGDWGVNCAECHNPHFQDQLNWVGSASSPFLVTGTIASVSINTPQDGQTEITYTGASYNPDWPAEGVSVSDQDWSRKNISERGLIFIQDTTDTSNSFSILDANSTTIVVQGILPPEAVDPQTPANLPTCDSFGLIYGQLIKDQIKTPFSGVRPVKLFSAGDGFVDDNQEGICQVCHTETSVYKNNQPISSLAHDVRDCTQCHDHAAGFKGIGGGGPDHSIHMDFEGFACNYCHYFPIQRDENGSIIFNDNQPFSATTICQQCHYDGTMTCDINNDTVFDEPCPPNHPEYKEYWDSDVFNLNCDGCHKGRADVSPAEEQMSTNGHQRLVGEDWIRHYPCTYCHYDTVNSDGTLTALHLNGEKDVKISPQWAVVGEPSYNETTKVCSNTYCHTDGTTENPGMRDYPWTGGRRDCNSCHAHDPDDTGDCINCHSLPLPVWSDEQRWLSAMPMYQNTGPGTPRANSHFRHLFNGFSCDDCHADTVVGACRDCHGETLPQQNENMNEIGHVNPEYHVNRVKNVSFMNGGTYDPQDKSCENTACHTGNPPVWGGSVHDDVVCKECHGTSQADVDDFGKFNSDRARINLGEWATTGHGRPAEAGPYPSGNPPANFPDKGCWYCHDSRVLHQNEERPFRLIQHEHFQNRFEKECVFCHMTGDDQECLGCHNAQESLAPQLDTIPSDPAVNPPYSIAQPDHTTYNISNIIGGQSTCNASTCHEDDTSRHKTNAGIWTTAQQDDVKNSYLQMGVCLKCHDDDSGGQCNSCHTGPQYALGFDPADLDPELAGYTSGMIVPQIAKAASFHFGYKHFTAYETSLNDVVVSDTTSDEALSTRYLLDSDQAWTPDEFVGRHVVINPGTAEEVRRPIIRNSETKLTVAPLFPDSDPVTEGVQPIPVGTPYEIINIVWKGGKFCWDCHDPHGDSNIYMIQAMVATRTDGIVGKPVEGFRAAVSFTRKQSGSDYAKIEAPFNGICNVCHTDPDMYYQADYGGTHNQGRVCTECHEHRFTDNHASEQTCNTCHSNRPVPRHTGFSQARDCTKCHKDAINSRMNIMLQFSANSHHVQGTEVNNRHCYKCHWEATEEGVIDLEYHEGYNYADHSSTKDAPVDLVVWGPGVRPTVYDNDGVGNNDTAVTFNASKVDVSKPDVTLADQRGEVDKITVHCLGCHSDQNNDTEPFDDCKTPRQYAWDRTSVEARYGDQGTAVFGKVSGPNATQKSFTKAFSAHGNAVNNAGGFSAANGEDVINPLTDNTRRGQVGSEPRSYNVQCFDCHSSHGSMVGGITSSYTTFNGTKNGANLKETQAGKGGYAVTYRASANLDTNSVNPFEAGAGQCFDCHESAMIGTVLNPLYQSPWGYTETFGAEASIMGYRDSSRFGDGPRGITNRFPYKLDTIAGGHLRASSDLNNSASHQINGLCTPCHDPHGVSPALGDNKQNALPLLKGTWMTTPYKEDIAASGKTTSDRFTNSHNYWSTTRPPNQGADGRGPGGWRTDRNTLNQKDLSVKANISQIVPYDRISEPADQFAGLCLRCHPKDALTSDPGVTPTENIPWKSMQRIHRSVQGWGWEEGDDEREHSFTCSKCHSAHISGLPRLMRTNCLNYSHRGQQASGGAPGSGGRQYYGKFPFGWYNQGDTDFLATEGTARCHGASTANGSANWPANQGWNNVTPW